MIKIKISDFLKSNNPDMKARFKEVESMKFETIKKAEYFILSTFGSVMLENKKYMEVVLI